MLRFLAGTIALALSTLPISAQTTAPGGAGQMTSPSGPNSGAGIPGKPGGKSGPAVKSPSATTGSAQTPSGPSTQDPAKIPGLPGGKSGPAVKSPSSGSPPR